MKSVLKLNSSIPSKITSLLALGIAGVALIGAIGLTTAAQAAVRSPNTETRDHRTKPVVYDHRGGTETVTHDHRGDTTGGTRVGPGKPRPRQVPCLGNLC